MEREILRELPWLHQIGKFGEYEVTEVWCDRCYIIIQNPSIEWIRSAPTECEQCKIPLSTLVVSKNEHSRFKKGKFLLATVKYDMGGE